MTDKTDSKEREVAEQWLRDRYGAYRGHFAWRELEEAFLAGRASLAVSAESGPLMGQPQEMPDLSALTERGAKAWAGVDARELREGFTAADMATASAQGFRDGVASLAASAGSEPVAVVGSNFALYWAGSGPIAPIVEKHSIKVGSPLYTHPSPPEGMVATDAMIDAGKKMLHNSNGRGAREKVERIFNAMIAAAQPTTSAGSGKGGG